MGVWVGLRLDLDWELNGIGTGIRGIASGVDLDQDETADELCL